ncbi:OmpP1/FadL family transporter [Oricola nitratireducens]|uniref:OmpP1/FadL family transporter n=1 Tax=Oricola nitratireducens TaxID=2775868 RepID=UPI001866CCE2|nr:outer membrane protein transport protein [Oricola nitratireducens]
MKRHSNKNISGLLLGSLVALSATCAPAFATDGYFQVGFGARQGGMGGAGVADSTDAMAQTLNPAGIVGVKDQWQIGGALFMPFRGYEATGAGFVARPGVDSDANIFVMPNFALVRQIDSQSAWGISVYGNGGMNTTYPNVANPSCGPGSGIFCGGATGVDLMQAFISVDYARQMGPLKVGIAPTLAVQRFMAKGLTGFGVPENGYDYSVGGGVRAGIEWEAMPGLRFGLSGQTKMYMTKFDKYAGLFAEQGGFDIPAQITAGVAFDATPDLTLAFDYQRIFYGGVPSISNSSTLPPPFGADNGPGFGWHDVNVFKIGAEWQANAAWTLRAGYAYSDNPIKPTDVMLNILAPGVTQHHISAGASYKMSDRNTVDFFAMYVPETKVTGPDVMGAPGSEITLKMHQFQLGFGLTRTF